MKKRILFPLALGATIAIGSLASYMVQTHAEGATQPGSVDDPIITKSYVDQQLKQMVADEVKKQQSGSPGTPTPSDGGSLAVNVIELNPGQIIRASAGTEFIVRTGTAFAVSNSDDGIPDVTGGVDIRPNAAVKTNHLLLFPRNDGRGIKADPKGAVNIFVMVRGGYTIE